MFMGDISMMIISHLHLAFHYPSQLVRHQGPLLFQQPVFQSKECNLDLSNDTVSSPDSQFDVSEIRPAQQPGSGCNTVLISIWARRSDRRTRKVHKQCLYKQTECWIWTLSAEVSKNPLGPANRMFCRTEPFVLASKNQCHYRHNTRRSQKWKLKSSPQRRI